MSGHRQHVPQPLPGWAAPIVGWVGLAATSLARIYLVVAATFALSATVPMVFGWQTLLVRSGSMRPSLQPGDLVVAAPVPPNAPTPLGRVMSFADPADPAKRLVHRVVVDRGDGTYTTAGDANRSDDSSPVARAAIHGLARLRIPGFGLPALWWARGDSMLFGLWLGLTIIALALVGLRRTSPALRRHRPARIRRHALVRVCAAQLVAVTVVVSAAPAAASSGFTDRTVNAGDNWAANARLLQPYTAAVLTDLPYLYYTTDESAGPVAVDTSGNNRPGTYSGTITYRQPDGLPTNPGYSVQLGGNQARLVSGGPAVSNPTTFSLELWFKTATTSGGKLIGFESTQAATSYSYDRHLFMRTDGRISYGGWQYNTTIITTPTAYNDNAWHHLVVTSRPINGSSNRQAAIYVDGINVVSGPTTATASYSGWWRVGFGGLTTGRTGYPTTASFAGSIDNVAIYTTELSAGRVAAHYAAR